MKDPKNLALFLIPYLTICGALYHISYWDAFNINGLAFITVGDIIKSSVYPILSGVFALLLGMIFGLFVFPLDKFLPYGGGRDTSVGKKLNSALGKTLLIIFLGIVVFSIVRTGKLPERWLLAGYLLSLPCAIWFERTGILFQYIPDIRIRVAVCQLLFYFPILSFCIGKFNAELIYKNISYKYTISRSISSITKKPVVDTFKFLGSTEKHFIFSDLQNARNMFVQSDKIDTLIFLEKARDLEKK